MTNAAKNQSGFSPIIIIIVLAVAAIYGTYQVTKNLQIFSPKASEQIATKKEASNAAELTPLKLDQYPTQTPTPSPEAKNTSESFVPGAAFANASKNKITKTPTPSPTQKPRTVSATSTPTPTNSPLPSATPRVQTKIVQSTTASSNLFNYDIDDQLTDNKGKIYIITERNVAKGCLSTADVYVATNNISDFGTDVIINYDPSILSIHSLKPGDINIGSEEYAAGSYTSQSGKIIFDILSIRTNQTIYMAKIAKIEFIPILSNSTSKQGAFSLEFDQDNLAKTTDTNIVDYNDKTYSDHFEGGNIATFNITTGICS